MDRELLELAAKAAGIKELRSPDGVLRDCTGGDPMMNIFASKPWNPIKDDGDALRLAVNLGIGTMHHQGWGQVMHPNIEDRLDFKYDEDPLAATRRAIVRAAAEIGRSMK